MRKILHVSDVHFGPKHLPTAAEALHGLALELQPDLVVLAGDQTLRAKPAQFRQARAWADRFAAPVIAVPGNHDVPLYRVWERVFVPYGAYRKHFDAQLEPRWEDEEMVVVGLNSAFGWTTRNGRLTARSLQAMKASFAAAGEGRTRVVICHHPLIAPDHPDHHRILNNAPIAAAAFAEAQVDLVLSGHQHQTYFGTTRDLLPNASHTTILANVGTSASSRGRGAEIGLNTASLVKIGEGVFSFSVYSLKQSASEFELANVHQVAR